MSFRQPLEPPGDPTLGPTLEPTLEQRRVVSFDGTDIGYQAGGAPVGGPDDPLPLVLCNGLGGDYRAWKYVVQHFCARHHIVTWDYRGLYHSGRPVERGTLGPPAQARDLFAVAAAEKINRFVLIGWSMGVQVAFEIYRRDPARVAGIAAVNGVAGRPFDTVVGGRLVRSLIPKLLKLMRLGAPVVGRVTTEAVKWPALLPTMQRLGMVGATLDMAFFAEFSRSFATMDFDLYGATLASLGKHDAWDVLPEVRVPVALVTGDRDMLTPLTAAERMRSLLPDATLTVLPGGTHYTPLEFPEDVCAAIERLLARVK